MTEKQERSFAELLDYLFQEVHPPDRGPYTYQEVVQGIRDSSDFKITASAIQQLRTGVNKNPKLETVRALADFFGVPAAYFFEEDAAERARAEIGVVAAMQDRGVRRVALRAAGLSTEGLQILGTVIDQVRKLEGMAGDPDGGLDLDD
jgi:transcriptional regulator with XRE-family HTH domain